MWAALPYRKFGQDRCTFLVVIIVLFSSIDNTPTRVDNQLTSGLEFDLRGLAQNRGRIELTIRIKHRNKSTSQQVINQAFLCTQIVGWNTRRNNGVVIGNLRIIEHILRLLELLVRLKQSGCQLLVSSQSPKDIRALGIDVIGKISGINTRIGCYLLFVEALNELECLVGTESELAVAIDLQGCEIIKSLGTLLARLLLDIGDGE